LVGFVLSKEHTKKVEDWFSIIEGEGEYFVNTGDVHIKGV
jgi:uncharacterized cupin superfamily protein